MSNKTQLQTNNDVLLSLATRVNAAKEVAASLPEAGGNMETYNTLYISNYILPDDVGVDGDICIVVEEQ